MADRPGCGCIVGVAGLATGLVGTLSCAGVVRLPILRATLFEIVESQITLDVVLMIAGIVVMLVGMALAKVTV